MKFHIAKKLIMIRFRKGANTRKTSQKIYYLKNNKTAYNPNS